MQHGKKKPGAIRLMEAAHDHGFKDGYILPFHFVDSQGRAHSALVALFWKDEAAKLQFSLASLKKHELNLVLLYWVQRVLAILGSKYEEQNSFINAPDSFSHLTDREREVLSWAGRGRSASETSDLLKIGQETVKTHLVHAMQKLEAINKTHAVAKAVRLGLIDL